MKIKQVKKSKEELELKGVIETALKEYFPTINDNIYPDSDLQLGSLTHYPVVSRGKLENGYLIGRVRDEMIRGIPQPLEIKCRVGYVFAARLKERDIDRGLVSIVPLVIQVIDYIKSETKTTPGEWKAGTHFLKIEEVQEIEENAGYTLVFTSNVRPMLEV